MKKEVINGITVDVYTDEELRKRGAAVNAKFRKLTAEESRQIQDANAFDPKRVKKSKTK